MIVMVFAMLATAGFCAVAVSEDTSAQDDTVTYNAVFLNGDNIVTVITGEGGITLTAPDMNGVEKEGYTFDGWSPEIPATLTASGVYKAVWIDENGDAEPTDYDKGYADGVISVEQDYTEADITDAYDEGYADGVASVEPTTIVKDNSLLLGCIVAILSIVTGILLIWVIIVVRKANKVGYKLT